jgi:hypothetical protein
MGFLLATQLALAPWAGKFIECLQVRFHKALARALYRGEAYPQGCSALFIRQPLIGLE